MLRPVHAVVAHHAFVRVVVLCRLEMGGGVGDESVFVRGERSDLAFWFFLKVNKGWGRGDAGRTSSGRGGASIESSDVTANSSSCGWLSTAWDHPRGGGREGASESGVACGSNEMASAQLVAKSRGGRMSLPSGGGGAGLGTRGTRAHLRLLQAGVHDVAVLLIGVLKLRIAHLHGGDGARLGVPERR